MHTSIILTIEKLAGLGDGAGVHEGRRVFVPYACAGDVVRARIVRETKDAAYAALEEVITPGPGRVKPACRHFAVCGGCALQHVSGTAYRDFKQQTAREAVRKAGFDPDLVEPLVQPAPASRRRVELKVENGKLGYYAERSHRLIDIEECKVLEPALETLVRHLKPQLIAQAGLESVQINGVDGGYDILLRGAQALPLEGEGIARVSVQDASGLRTLYQRGPVTVTLGGLRVEPPPGAFMQASREAQEVMTRFVQEAVGQAAHVLDLFAGLGTYSFPLAAAMQVTAMEGDTSMVKAMQEAAKRHGLGQRFKAIQRDLFRHSVAEGLDAYDAVVINPPRTGAREQTLALATARVKKLVMISCNPATFARDARLLKEKSYRLIRALPIDQFAYSPHLEILAKFVI